MRKFLFTIFLLLLNNTLLVTQEPTFDLNRLLKANKLEDVRKEVKIFVKNNQGEPRALYLEAVVETEAEKALENYKRIIVQFPKSEPADEALFRIAQYYFSRGLYISARRHFLNLVEDYPESPFVDDSKYLAAACLFAVQKVDSCRNELKSFLLHYPNSPFANLAKEDLKEIKLKRSIGRIDSKVTERKSKGKYTLQIGAFSQINNALNQREYFSKFGLPVEIREKTDNGRTLYLLWIGSFGSKNSAEAFGKTFKKEYGKVYRIVERNR